LHLLLGLVEPLLGVRAELDLTLLDELDIALRRLDVVAGIIVLRGLAVLEDVLHINIYNEIHYTPQAQYHI
jgi:hypothetical protein